MTLLSKFTCLGSLIIGNRLTLNIEFTLPLNNIYFKIKMFNSRKIRFTFGILVLTKFRGCVYNN